MSEQLTCVQNTEYAEFFDEAPENTVFLLPLDSANNIWNQNIHAGTASYFDLPDDCWIVKHKPAYIGSWLEDFNTGNYQVVAKTLGTFLDWDEQQFIRFFINKNFILKTKWCDFISYWDEFLTLHDDCPILIPEGKMYEEAILFNALGNILKVT